jgi:hypothetical protein
LFKGNIGENVNLSDFEDKPIIGTDRLEPFQRMCSMAGAFAVYEAKQAGLLITSDQIAADMAVGFNIGNWPIAFSAGLKH